MDLIQALEEYGILRFRQGQATPDDTTREPYDLRCDADALFKKIAGELAMVNRKFPSVTEA